MSAKLRALLLVTLAFLVSVPGRSAAFCGFYVSGADASLFNNATTVVLLRDGTRTVLSMQNNYQGPPERFAMVVPVPVILQEENVKTLPKEIFAKVDAMAAPRLVEYWEQDPCYQEPEYRRRMMGIEDGAVPPAAAMAFAEGALVKVEAEFTVGEYDIVILSARDALALDTWLRENQYKIPAGAAPFLKPYVEGGMYFFVARVDVSKVRFENGQAMLSPLRFHYDSEQFNLPVRLGLINSSGTQDLIVHILSPNQRYEVANYPNVVIPTNLRVTPQVKDQFAAFYAALFDRTLEQNPGAIITEYAWAASSCDPCPGPTLDQGDFMTLGADVLPGGEDAGWKPWVLTRLHSRYGKENLGEDLVFRAADPLTGGIGMPGPDGTLPQQTDHVANMFQGRYAILHPWEDKISCSDPVRGRWGGPPGGVQPVTAASNLAFAPRGEIALTSLVVSGLSGIQPIGPAADLGRPLESFGQKVPVAKKSPWFQRGENIVLLLLSLGIVALLSWAAIGQLREGSGED